MKFENGFSIGISLGFPIRIEPALTPKPEQKTQKQ
jgi:hypothetical protein